jgi:hypothetical protein
VNRRFALFAFATLAISPVAAEPPLGAADYRPSSQHPFGWRGDGTGRFPAATPPAEWSAIKNVRWKVVVGRGYASPIFAGDLVVVAAEPNLLIGVNRGDGAIRWKVEITPADVPDDSRRKAAEEYQPPKDGSGMAAATNMSTQKPRSACRNSRVVKPSPTPPRRKTRSSPGLS